MPKGCSTQQSDSNHFGYSAPMANSDNWKNDAYLDQILSITKRRIYDFHIRDSGMFHDKDALIGSLVIYAQDLETALASNYSWRPFLMREEGLSKWRRMVRKKDIWGNPREDSPWG